MVRQRSQQSPTAKISPVLSSSPQPTFPASEPRSTEAPKNPDFQGLSSELSMPIQAKLTVGEPNDKYEQEADRVAAQVVQQIHAPAINQSKDDSVQRKEESPDITPLKLASLQRKNTTESSTTSSGFESAINQSRGTGQSLPNSLRPKLENAFGSNLGNVRIHNNASADRLSRSVQAKAFTTGNDIFFKKGEYKPQTTSGQQLLAHELTHTIQQNAQNINRSMIQRAIGIELECTNLEINDEPSDAEKGDVLDSDVSDKWTMTYEETSEGSPVVEFVGYPAAETKTEFKTSIGKMKDIAQTLDDGVERTYTGTKGDYKVQKAGTIEGAVQATIGVPLADLPKVFTEFEVEDSSSPFMTAYKRFKDLTATKTQTTTYQTKEKKKFGPFPYTKRTTHTQLTDISDQAPDGTMVRSLPAETQGLILLLMEYVNRGYVPTSWRGQARIPFAKGLYPLMARTDFKSIFKSLPTTEQNRISAVDLSSGEREMKEDWWKWIIKKAIGNDSLSDSFLEDDLFFNQILENIDNRNENSSGPTRSEFLKKLPTTDSLKDEGYLGFGKLRNKADISDSGTFGIIFELRKPYGSSVAYSKWGTVADEMWQKYENVVGSTPYKVGGRIT